MILLMVVSNSSGSQFPIVVLYTTFAIDLNLSFLWRYVHSYVGIGGRRLTFEAISLT